jgi:hypothetical protein
MSHDELLYHLAPILGKPICAMQPSKADLFIKTIRKMKLGFVHIQKSIVTEKITVKNKNYSYSIISADLSNTIGNNVNLDFKVLKNKKNVFEAIHGNHTLLIFDHKDGGYYVTNGDSNFYLDKIDSRNGSIRIPAFDSASDMSIQTNKASKIKRAIRSAKYVELLIYDRSIASVCLPGVANFNFEPLATSDYIENHPDLRLRAHHFLHLSAPEVRLKIGVWNQRYWLHTSIDVTDTQSISQYEMLTVVK